jgi:hypothetical protein
MSKELAKKETGELTVSALFNSEYTGYENITSDCLSIPFIKIAQSNSDEVLEDNASYIKGLKPGYFFNTVTRKSYGKNLKFIGIGQSHTFIEWGGSKGTVKRIITELEYRRLPESDRLSKDDEGKPALKENFNLFVLLADHIEDGIIIFPFASTKIKFYKKFLTSSVNTMTPDGKSKCPMFGVIWEATTVINENDSGKWYNVGDKGAPAIKMIEYTPNALVKPVLGAIEIVKSYIDRAKEIDYGAIKEDKEENASF